MSSHLVTDETKYDEYQRYTCISIRHNGSPCNLALSHMLLFTYRMIYFTEKKGSTSYLLQKYTPDIISSRIAVYRSVNMTNNIITSSLQQPNTVLVNNLS